MIVEKCLQRSAEWLKIRCGKPTASNFKNIVTSTGKPASSTVRAGYRNTLVAERMTGLTQGEGYVSPAMERGTLLESEARRWFAFEADESVTEVGFVWKDKSKLFGCSPDGITTTGGIEIKCLEQKGHVAALLRGKPPADHMVQIQACMWITERSHWRFVLWTDVAGLPNVIWRIEPDEVMFAAFDEQLPKFCAEVADAVKQVKSMG